MNTSKEKIKLKLLIGFFVVIMLLLVIIRFTTPYKNKPSFIQTEDNHLLSSYSSTFHKINVYEYGDKIIINAYSEGKLDEPNQLVVKIDGGISKEDIQVDWETVGGVIVEEGNENVIAANVKIQQDEKVILDETISLFEEGWKALDTAVSK